MNNNKDCMKVDYGSKFAKNILKIHENCIFRFDGEQPSTFRKFLQKILLGWEWKENKIS